ncbi:MAG: GNAT family N-acetyltransferase [Acidobacteriota bacterium]|nr:GNAT family N-acetyltransferase [Acidobacteriota bacterium]MDE3106775.1 GNAT family N-acetyltransferase [Acidobacteriota bacterium]
MTTSRGKSRTINPWCATSSRRPVSRWTTTDLRTSRLALHPPDETEIRRVLANAPEPTDHWSEGFPSDGDVHALASLLERTLRYGDQRPFGVYLISRLVDGVVIGGIGFHSAPDDGRVEIGFGIAPEARGHGFASEAATALVGLAGELGVRVVFAVTTPENAASRKTLLNAGFRQVRVDLAECVFEVQMNESEARDELDAQ